MQCNIEIKSKVICGFTGVGKTFFSKSKDKVIDIDHSLFRNLKNPNKAYFDYVCSCNGSYEYILISTHSEIRDMLHKNNIQYYLVYPEKCLKDEYKERFISRGNSESYAKLIYDMWDEWIGDLNKDTRGIRRVLKSGEYLSDIIREFEK